MSVACVTDTLPISSVRRNLFKQQMVLLVSIFDIYVFSDPSISGENMDG